MAKRQSKENTPSEPGPEPSTPPPSMTLDSLLTVAGRLATLAGAVVGLGYLVGYMIVNLYLNMLGVRPPDLIASRYLATGVLYLFTTALPLVPLFIGWRMPIQLPETMGKWAARLLRVFTIVIGILGTLMLHAALTNFVTGSSPTSTADGNDPSRFWWAAIGFVFNSIICWFGLDTIMPLTKSNKMLKEAAWLRISGSFIIIPLILIVTVAVFAGFVYPRARSAYGGGAPTSVQLMLDPDNALTQVLPMSFSPGVTNAISLIDQNDDGYFVYLSDKQEIVMVPRDAVRGVIAKPAISSRAILPP